MTQQQTLQVQSINQQNVGFLPELAYLPIGGTAAAEVSPSAAQSFSDKGDGLSESNFPGWTEITTLPDTTMVGSGRPSRIDSGNSSGSLIVDP